MSRLINLMGKKFDDLTVINRCGSNADKKALWVCLCVCGNAVIKSSKSLFRAKDKMDCGILHPYKICSQCKIDKPKTEYHICKNNKNGISPKCKKCICKRYENEKEAIKIKYKQSMLIPANREKKREQVSKARKRRLEKERLYKYSYSRKPTVIARRNKNHKERKLVDINYNIKRRLRWRVRDIVNNLGNNKYKFSSSLELLGCDLPFFKKYLESKFKDGMCWDMLCEIHIDHIKPCSKFDLTKLDEQRKCFHYSNLQPLWKLDNLKKGHKYNINSEDSPLLLR